MKVRREDNSIVSLIFSFGIRDTDSPKNQKTFKSSIIKILFFSIKPLSNILNIKSNNKNYLNFLN